MSSEVTKMLVRMKLEVTTIKEALPILDHLDLEYHDYDEEQDYIWEVDDEHWDLKRDGDDVYLDYVLARSSYDEPYIDASISIAELTDIVSKIPVEFQPQFNDVKVVGYTYYNGTDEPIVF